MARRLTWIKAAVVGLGAAWLVASSPFGAPSAPTGAATAVQDVLPQEAPTPSPAQTSLPPSAAVPTIVAQPAGEPQPANVGANTQPVPSTQSLELVRARERLAAEQAVLERFMHENTRPPHDTQQRALRDAAEQRLRLRVEQREREVRYFEDR